MQKKPCKTWNKVFLSTLQYYKCFVIQSDNIISHCRSNVQIVLIGKVVFWTVVLLIVGLLLVRSDSFPNCWLSSKSLLACALLGILCQARSDKAVDLFCLFIGQIPCSCSCSCFFIQAKVSCFNTVNGNLKSEDLKCKAETKKRPDALFFCK